MKCVNSHLQCLSTRTRPETINNGGSHAAFPGAKAPYTTEIKFLNEHSYEPIPIYRVLDSNGEVIDSREEPDIDKDTLLNMYRTMIQLNQMDKILYESQRRVKLIAFLYLL